MKVSRYCMALAALCVAPALIAQAPPAQRPGGNPIEVKTGDEVLQGDRKTTSDTGRAGPATAEVDPFPKGEPGDLLRRHLLAINGVGSDKQQKYQDAEKAYQASLRELRARAAELVPLLARAYAKTPEGDYFRRWQLVETLRELQHASAAATLVKIATTAIPPERFRSDPERDSVGEEIRIRVTAAEALGQLAKQDKVAERTLLGLAKSPHIGVQRAAVRGYLSAAANPDDQQKRSAKLKGALPANRHGLLALETTDVKTVEHPEMPDKFDIKKRRPPEGAPPKARQQP